MKLKYQVGQRFRCLVPQRLVLGMANGVPVPFGQVASDTKRAKAQGIDVPVGTIVVLEADFQCQLPDGTTKRAYVLRIEGHSVFFADRVLTRKYERIIIDPHERVILAPVERIIDPHEQTSVAAECPAEAKALQDDPAARRQAREDRLRTLGFEEPTAEQCKVNLALNVALCDWPKDCLISSPELASAGRARGVSFTPSDPPDGPGEA